MRTNNGYNINCYKCNEDDADNTIHMAQITDAEIITEVYVLCDDCYDEIDRVLETKGNSKGTCDTCKIECSAEKCLGCPKQNYWPNKQQRRVKR